VASNGARIGLVLTGGGAHAAYQAGVIRGISEIITPGPTPFQVIAGVSAGAVTGMGVAARADDFQTSARLIWEIWEAIKPSDVFKTDPISLVGIGARWMRDLSLGGFLGKTQSNFLLDTSPLKALLCGNIHFEEIPRHIDSGLLHGVAVTATNFVSGTAVTFFDGSPELQPWYRSTRLAKRSRIQCDQVMASSAIPIFFPPVFYEGSYFGDGCVRMTAPLSPAVHMKADRILAIGTSHTEIQTTMLLLEQPQLQGSLKFVDIIGVLLNAVFLDSLETDMDRLQRINRTVSNMTPEQRAASKDKLRFIPLVAITPSRNLGDFASAEFPRFPAPLRYLLKGLGASERKGWDLLSYLAFDGIYTRYLLQLGYTDALNKRPEIEALLAP
jgi:NTE family protein